MNRVKKRQHKLESAELKITVKEAACQRGPQLTGQKDKLPKEVFRINLFYVSFDGVPKIK